VLAPWVDRRVLVTGGGGFLGTAVVAQLQARGVSDIHVPSSADVDLRDRAAAAELFAAVRPDLVIHLAARVGGIGYNRLHPAELYLDNLLMGTYVIEEARANDVAKTVVVGTVCSYPKEPPVPFHEESLWNGYPEETNAPYGLAKLAQLVHAQTVREQYGQEVIYLIPTNLYGPGDKFHPDISHVIPALVKRCVEAVEADAPFIELWGTGSASREFLYVDDAATGIVDAAERYDGAEPVNLGADHEMPIRELIGHIAEATGYRGEIRWDPTKPDGQPRRRVDASRARQLFGFEAKTDFADGLRRTVDWYLANRQQAERPPHGA
jgi:GDP-L-fucose synthase